MIPARVLIPGAALVAAPFTLLFQGQVYEAQMVGLALAAALALTWASPSRAAGALLVLAVFWLVATRLLVLGPSPTRPDVLRYSQAQAHFWQMLAGFAVYVVVARMVRAKDLGAWADVILASALLMCAWAGLQAVGGDPILKASSSVRNLVRPWTMGALAGHPNFLAAYLACCLPFAMRRGRWWAVPILAVVLVVQQTTGGIMAAGAAVAYAVWRQWRRLFYVVVGIGGALGALYVTIYDPLRFSIMSRWATWKWAVSDPSVLGHGTGSWAITIAPSTSNPWVFNEYLQVFFEWGGLGLALVAGAVIWRLARPAMRHPLSPLYHAAFIALVVNALVNPILRIPATATLGVVLLGLWEVANGRRYSRTD